MEEENQTHQKTQKGPVKGRSCLRAERTILISQNEIN